MFDASPNSFLTALVVDPDDGSRTATESVLLSAGFTVVAAANYHEALPLLLARPLALVTEVRLGVYNGLHLAIRGQSERPDMALLVISSFHDIVLEREAAHLGATFLAKPVTPADLLAAVYRTAARSAAGGIPSEPVRAPFERRRQERRQEEGAVASADRRLFERRRGIVGLLVRATVQS